MNKPMIVSKALAWLDDNGVPLPSDLRLQLETKGLIHQSKDKAMKQSDSIESINATYHDAITGAIVDYFESNGAVSSYKNEFKKAMSDAFVNAFELGWQDGGQDLPLDDDALDWLGARQSQEFGYIDMLFAEAKQLRKETDFDYFNWATMRADGYTASILSIYNAAVLLAKKNQMLTWNLGQTEKHCDTCLKLDSGRHRASWYIGHDYIPRKPGAAMDCKGYNCDCSLTTDDGEEVTI